MGIIIWKTGCIKTKKISIYDVTTFAKRKGRTNLSRVVKDLSGKNTSLLTLIIKDEKLITSWIWGLHAVKEPTDENIVNQDEFNASIDYWTNNALIYDERSIWAIIFTSFYEILKESKFLLNN
jgi:hypothetical protein